MLPNTIQFKCVTAYQSKNLFNLTGLISFTKDCIAKDDVTFFAQQLSLRHFHPPIYKELFGSHFEPNGIQIEHLGACINGIFAELSCCAFSMHNSKAEG